VSRRYYTGDPERVSTEPSALAKFFGIVGLVAWAFGLALLILATFVMHDSQLGVIVALGWFALSFLSFYIAIEAER